MNRRMILNTIMLGMFIFLFAFKLFPRPWHQIAGVLVLLPVQPTWLFWQEFSLRYSPAFCVQII